MNSSNGHVIKWARTHKGEFMATTEELLQQIINNHNDNG